MSRTYGKAQDLIDFTRASSGTALRRVKYGPELVTNGTFDNGLTGWNNSPTIPMDTFEVSSGRLHIVNTAGTVEAAYSDDTISLVAGRMYTFSADLEKVGGTDNWDIDIRSEGTGTVRNVITYTATTETLVVHFIATVTEDVVIQITARDTFEGYADNISVKEVTFDTSDGDLVLFNHPNNIPRIEYDANGNVLGLLVEESRTNLIPYSDDFSASEWVKYYSIAVSPSSTVSPDGQQNAYELTGIESSDGDLGLTDNLVASPSTTYTASIWVKAANTSDVGKYVKLRSKRSGGTFVAEDQEIQLTSEWVRHSVTITLLADNTGASLTITKATAYPLASRADSCLIYRAQYEQGSFPTSAIPTSGSTATRSADVASIGVDGFGYRQDAFTVFIEASHLYDTFPTFNRFWELSGGGDSLGLYGNAGGSSYVSMTVGGVQQISFSDGSEAAADANTFMKYGIGLKTNDFDIARDGSLDTGDTSVTMPDAIDTFNIGKAGNDTAILNGHIKSIKYYPRRLLNSQLQELTS